MTRLLTLVCCVSLGCGTTSPPPAALSFEDEGAVLEPEAGPSLSPPDAGAPLAVVDAGTPDTGLPLAVDAGAPALPDAGAPDVGPIPEPVLPDEALQERFERALLAAYDEPQLALNEFDAISRKAPDFYFAHYNAALCLARTGDVRGAETRLLDLVARFGERYYAPAEALATLKVRAGDREGGLAILQEEQRKYPYLLPLANALGRMLNESGRFEEAGDLAMATLKKDEVNVGAMQVLGWSFCKRGKMELCQLVLNNALEVPGESQNGLGNYLYALMYWQWAKGAPKLVAEGRMRAAEKYLEVALKAMPDRPELLINFGRIALERGNSARALRLTKRVTTLEPSLVAGWLVHGVALRDSGSYSGARNAFLKVLSLDAERHEALFNLGILYLDHDFPVESGVEFCPDVSTEDMKHEVGGDLFDGVAIKHLDKKNVDSLRRMRQATVFLRRFGESPSASPELERRLKQTLRQADKAIKKEAKKRSKNIRKAKKAAKREARRKKKMAEEAARKAEEAASAPAGEGAAVAPEGAAVAPEGAAVAPEGAAVAPEGAAVAPEGNSQGPAGDEVAPAAPTNPPVDPPADEASEAAPVSPVPEPAKGKKKATPDDAEKDEESKGVDEAKAPPKPRSSSDDPEPEPSAPSPESADAEEEEEK
jgi:Flp pilus assembly protein TadD